MNIIHTHIDSALHDIVQSKTANHLGVFEGHTNILQGVEALWNVFSVDASHSNLATAFQQYPLLKTIFQMLQRPGQRAFVFSTRDGYTLAAVRTNIIDGEHVWFRWVEAPELEEAVTKQCLDRNIYGHAITVWSYC
jgi:hypothetical protein